MKVVQVCKYVRGRMLAPGHLVVETSGKSRTVKQEERNKVDLLFIDHEGATRCAMTEMLVGSACSLFYGTCTPCSEDGT